MLKFNLRNYIDVICIQLKKININSSEQDRLKYEPMLRKLLIKKIKEYNSEWKDFSFKGNEWIYELAYPKRMRLYWFLMSIKNKIIR